MENVEQPPVEKLTDPKSIENVKSSIHTIEGLFHAVNAASFPLSWHDTVKRGMQFLNGLHTQLVAQLPAEVVQAIKDSQNSQAPASEAVPPAPEAPQAPPTGESPVQVVN